MRAATIVDGAIEVRDRPDPEPGAGELLIRVRAAGLNGADLMQKAGGYPPPPGAPEDIPGMELAGEVVAVGAGVRRFATGDRVMAIVGGGAQAELCVVHERVAMPVPDRLGWLEAGGVPEVFTTAHDALFTQGALQVGERLCVHGAAGGVGVAGVQLGVATGARVTATVRNPDARAKVEALGATVIDPADFVDHGPYDVILELVGAPNWPANLDALDTGGRISVIGVGAGAKVELNLLKLMGKRGTIRASTLRARPLEAKADAARRMETHVLPLLAAGKVTAPIHATFPLEQAAGAYDHFAAGSKFGKVILDLT
jgi:NADPH2:quinone reductase